MARRRVAVVALLALGAAGCGDGDPTIDVVLINRSDATLVFAPGIVVGPCAEGSYSEREIRAAGEEWLSLSQNSVSGDERDWVPSAAVLVEGIPPSRIDAAKPEIYVISGRKLPYVSFGILDETTLPACGGKPVLGPE